MTTNFQDVKKHIQDTIKLQDNTTILENIDQLHMNKIENGILTIWVTWSIGYLNCLNAINYLYEKKYRGKIIIIDNDAVPPDFQKKTLGKVALHGWGEIFIIQKGQIFKEFRGQHSSISFKEYFDQTADA